MMLFYKMTWAFVFTSFLHGDLSSLRALALPFAITTFVFMFKAAKEAKGNSYATKNTIIAVLLSAGMGLGFIIWPILVNSEIQKNPKNDPRAD
jgi:hypothetical protein